MMKHEFEELAGYEVSFEDYNNIIEPMYMAIPEHFTKADFVKMIDKKRFALPTRKEMVRSMKKIAQGIFENCGARSFWKEEEELDRVAKAYARRFFGINWSEDMTSYVYTTKAYAYHGYRMERGCSFPEALIIGRGDHEFERIQLVKE